MPRTRGRGAGYEILVANILRSKGYRVRRNVRGPYGEADIIASKGGKTYLFEVKHRPSTPIMRDDIVKLVRKASRLKAIPVLAVSLKTKFHESAIREIKGQRVRVVWVKYGVRDWVRRYRFSGF